MKKVEQNDSLELKKKMSGLSLRIISAIVLSILTIIYIFTSIMYTEGTRQKFGFNTDFFQYIFFAITILLTGFLIFELIKAFKITNWIAITIIILLSLILFIFPVGNNDLNIYSHFYLSKWFQWWYSLILIIVIFFSFIGIFISKLVKSDNIFDAIILSLIILMIIFAMKGFTYISLALENNGNLGMKPKYSFTTIIWIWITIILTDSFAYFGGSLFGKHKLAPSISPKKTVEGAIIGTTFAVIIGATIAITTFYLTKDAKYGPFSVPFYNLGQNRATWLPGLFLGLLTFVISVLGQMGDLLFSSIKRHLGIKDFSKLIPGHGGILDRMDSFIFVFFFMYFITLAIR